MFKKLLLVILVLLTCSNATLQKFTDGESWYSVTRNDGISITKNRVGILTTTPSYSLDVRGTVNATSYIGAFNGSLPTYVVTNNYHGSVTANYFIGDGSLLTNVVATVISGDVTLQSVTINGSLYVSSSAVSIFGDSVTINGNLYVSGDSNLGSGAGLSISQNSYSPNISPNYTTPNSVGQVWINTANYSMYMAAHTNNYAGWGYIGRASATTFNATTVAGLYRWYDASSASNFTLDGSNQVTQWNDLSGTLSHLNQTSASKMVYTTNVQNGLSALYSAGGRYMFGNLLSDINSNTQTVFIVFKPTGWANGGHQALISQANGANTLFDILKNTGNTNVYCYSYNTSQANCGVVANNTTTLMVTKFNGASGTNKINGTSTNISTGTAWDSSNTRYLYLGCDRNGGRVFEGGYFMEILVYKGALSDENIAIVETYLNNKWAVY